MGRLARILAALLSAILTLLVVIAGWLLVVDVEVFRGSIERRLAVALAREVPIHFETKGTVREARGFTSNT